jgi:hypothetical protein
MGNIEAGETGSLISLESTAHGSQLDRGIKRNCGAYSTEKEF